MRKNNFLMWINSVLSTLISMIGFTSCGSGADEYGCPYADYSAEGFVFNTEGEALEGIEIIVKSSYSEDRNHADTLTTNKDGKYFGSICEPYGNLKLIATDPQEVYTNDTIEGLTVEQVKEGKGWYEGEFRVSHNFELKKK